MSESAAPSGGEKQDFSSSKFAEFQQTRPLLENKEEGRFTPIFEQSSGQFIPLHSGPKPEGIEQEPDTEPKPDAADNDPAEDMEMKLAALEEEAYQQGIRKGRADAFKEEQERIKAALDKLHEIARELTEMKKIVLEEAEDQMVELVLAIGRKVILEEISTNGSLVVNAVREAIEKVALDEDIRIKVNPVDLTIIGENESELLGAGNGENHLSFIQDEKVPPGGCIVETNRQILEYDPEQRIRSIGDALRKKGAEK